MTTDGGIESWYFSKSDLISGLVVVEGTEGPFAMTCSKSLITSES